MSTLFSPLHLLSVALAGWMNRHQQAVIDYLHAENQRLKKQLDGRRLQLTDNQRRRLAVKAKALGRQGLRELETLFTADTLLAWHRKLVAEKWTYSRKSLGRPPVSQALVEMVLRMACENPRWGYKRMVGALSNLGFTVSAGTVRNILKRHGIDPAPERGKRTPWGTFLKTHWDLLAATDFFTVEVWTPRGLVTYYLLFTIHLATRRVYVAGITMNPNSAFMIQVARQLTDDFDGPLRCCRYLIMDRDDKFSPHFKAFLRREGIEPLLCPPRAPNCNAYAERFVRSVKEECLDRIIPIGLESLRRAVREFLVHYHGERNHQGLENRLIEPPSCSGTANTPVRRRERLGGMLSYYYRLAA